MPGLENDEEPASGVRRDGHALRVDAAEPELDDERRQEVRDRRCADVHCGLPSAVVSSKLQRRRTSTVDNGEQP